MNFKGVAQIGRGWREKVYSKVEMEIALPHPQPLISSLWERQLITKVKFTLFSPFPTPTLYFKGGVELSRL